jgi:hypothetical protein
VDRSETGSKSEHMSPHRLEFLLGLNSAKTDTLEKALEKTWIAHVVVAGIGFAMVFHVGHVLQALVGRYLPGTSDLETVAPIMLAIYLYYFMKTGPLLTAFNEAQALRDRLLKNYLEGQPEEGTVGPLHETSSFLAAAFYDDEPGLVHATVGSWWRWKLGKWVPYLERQPEEGTVGPLHETSSFLAAAFYDDEPGLVHAADGSWWRWKLGKWVPYFFITALVVSLAQAATLFLVYEAYHASTMFLLVIVIVLVLLITLYVMFWKPGPSQATTASRSTRPLVREIRDGDAGGARPPGKAQRQQTRRTLAVGVLFVFVFLWLVLFASLHRDDCTKDRVDQAQRRAGCGDLADAARPSPSR